MEKPEVQGKLLAELAQCAREQRKIIIEVNNQEYDDKHDLWLKLRQIRTRGRSMNELAQKAMTEMGEV